MKEKTQYTLEDQWLEVMRELAIRKKVYPAWISQGKIRRRDANRQYLAMQCVARTLKALIEKRDGVQMELGIKD